MSQLDKTFPTNDCAICILSPKLVEVGRHNNIQIITNAELEKIEGEAGRFTVSIKKYPRYINETKCTGCGLCTIWCPIVTLNEFDENLRTRKSIFIKYPQAIPKIAIIDREICLGCRLCEQLCEANAIDFAQKEELKILNVGAIILANGSALYNPKKESSEYGYGQFLNVITSIEYERVLSASGPFSGHILRPFDGKIPKRIAWIQCVGSRSRKIGNSYCSSVCCMYAIKEAIITKEHEPHIDCDIFFMDMRVIGKGFEEFYVRAEREYGINFRQNKISLIEECPSTREVLISFEDRDTGEFREEKYDLVVLSIGYQPSKSNLEYCTNLGIEINEYNFCKASVFNPLETNIPGIYACGTFLAPKDIPETVAESSGAVADVATLLSSQRNKLTTLKKYPPQIPVEDQEPRIGVFVCHCGINIGGVIDVPEVVKNVRTLRNVAYAEGNIYTCSQDTQDKIKQVIHEHKLNRIVVASCTPRTHESLFQNTIREAGLNPYLFELVNIREHCSWVHMNDPQAATEKAKELVSMMVAKARFFEPVNEINIPINPSGLIIGGGIAGMTAALSLADQGYTVYLIEKDRELGGFVRKIHYMLENENPQEFLRDLIDEIKASEKITVLLDTEIQSVTGYMGNFKVLTKNGNGSREIETGIIIIATGGNEYKPNKYLYGKDARILTQNELEQKIINKEVKLSSVVMIQCIGSREDNRPYCSKLCCANAIKNAIKLKSLDPDTQVTILHKDIRVSGFKEQYYEKARAMGVNFIRFSDHQPPKLEIINSELHITITDSQLSNEWSLSPDLVVLSTAFIPTNNTDLAQMLKVPLDQNGFFMEAHIKLRPLDFATDGIFLCGSAQWPKFISESIVQAKGAAARAARILSKESILIPGTGARVNSELCIGCGSCQEVCPYNAIEMLYVNIKLEQGVICTYQAHIIEALCKSCGTCSVTCPTQAISIPHFTDQQILEMVKVLTKN